MIAKEKQTYFIKAYLKPTLKYHGYFTNGQTWWKDKGDFFTLINLQNFSWNSKDKVDFCFNIGVALKVTMKDPERKRPTVHDLTVYLRENSYLPNDAEVHEYKSKTGYFLTDQTDLDKFTARLKRDFEEHILISLENINSLQDCVNRFGNLTFWGDQLKRAISENNLLSI